MRGHRRGGMRRQEQRREEWWRGGGMMREKKMREDGMRKGEKNILENFIVIVSFFIFSFSS